MADPLFMFYRYKAKVISTLYHISRRRFRGILRQCVDLKIGIQIARILYKKGGSALVERLSVRCSMKWKNVGRAWS